ncbi:MAG: TlpA family protein disulfide reductase [Clostridia bacterium]|nr:TlpA family protein disulfide reductase [Clostridia bacterium]
MKRMICAICAVLLLMLGTAVAEDATEAPDITVLDSEGNEVALSGMLGEKPAVINLWASWCPPCKAELPDFEEAFLRYGEEVNFLMVDLASGLNGETVEVGKAFIEEAGYTFPVYFDRDGSTFAVGYVRDAVPVTWFISADGTIRAGYVGRMEKESLTENIEAMLEEQGGAQP